MVDYNVTDLTRWVIKNALYSYGGDLIHFGFLDYALDPFGADALALTFLEAEMANFPPIFLRPTTGRHERLLPADGGLQIDVLDCAATNSAVSLFDTVDNTGTVSILTAFNGAVSIGKIGGWFNFAGGVHVAQALETHGTTLLSGNVELGSIGTHNILFNGKISSTSVSFTGSAAHNILLDTGALTIQTTTSGKIAVNAASDLDFDAGTSSAFNATTSMVFAAGTTASFAAGAGSDFTLGARGATVTLNQAGNTTLSGFTATSIIGGLNEVRASVHSTVPVYVAGENITTGDLVCLEMNGGVAKVYKCDNATAALARPVGIAKASALIGANCSIVTVGDVVINTLIGAGNEGEYVFMDAAPNTGKVTLTPPGAGVVMIVGVVSKVGAAGTAQIIYQPLLPTTF